MIMAIEKSKTVTRASIGRIPRIGDQVRYWQSDTRTKELIEQTGWLMRRHRTDDVWDITVMLIGVVTMRNAVPFSPTPKNGCWTYRD